MVRVIVSGSRYYKNYKQLADKLDEVILKLMDEGIGKSDIEIVSGGCRGADELGERFAKESCLRCSIFPADWGKHGKAAGPVRNEQMAAYASEADKGILVAFPIGDSIGTRNMIKKAKQYDLKVEVIEG